MTVTEFFRYLLGYEASRDSAGPPVGVYPGRVEAQRRAARVA
jgi:hypothetical protein